MIRTIALPALLTLCCISVARAADPLVSTTPAIGAFPLADKAGATVIAYDTSDATVVRIAAELLATDLQRITGAKPDLLPFGVAQTPPHAPAKATLYAGTLGHAPRIDAILQANHIDTSAISGKWEASLITTVHNPEPGVDTGLLVIGSDRRGTAYGLMNLSEAAGVSPWCWWADVPVPGKDALFVSPGTHVQPSPAVKYRGIFINDEDWGLHVWASQTFEPENKSIGPKTYEKVFELMLRLRLNYLWPAMHEVTREFPSIPENIELADRFGIVAGSSHCEPMLFNNVKWNEAASGKWDYTLNKGNIFAAWETQARTRGHNEAVWTLGIRGIHDRGMEGPNNIPARINTVTQVFQDQRSLINKYVTNDFGPVAQAFVPYKEVLTLYDAGLKVPDDVTLVWVDDNFGYIRRLGKPEERKRPGGAGVYWHLSYYGNPHSYTWINSTPPALMWEELTKAWQNDARNLWVLNVGDIKPMEIGIDYFCRLAWNPEAMTADSQPKFLQDFAARQFPANPPAPIADLLARFYRLGTIRKPELMDRAWALALSDKDAARLGRDYNTLLEDEEKLAASIPPDSRDAWFEMVGFPAQVLGATGLIFMADRAAQYGQDAAANDAQVDRQRTFLEQAVARYNGATANGKWKHIMPGLVTGKNLPAWNSQVRWPWGEKPGTPLPQAARTVDPGSWRDAASADRSTPAAHARWTPVPGLGHTGRAMALQPASLDASWKPEDPAAPTLEFTFDAPRGDGEALLDFLPTFRTYPGMQLRVAVSLDDHPAAIVEVPGSNGKEDENGPNRKNGIQDNFVRARLPLPALAAGTHTLKIRAIDPGTVIDRVCLPTSAK